MASKKECVMKSHLWILLLTGIYPYQAMALISDALETASDITSDVVHSVSDTAGDITDAALDVSVGTVQRILPPPRHEVVVTEEEEEESSLQD